MAESLVTPTFSVSTPLGEVFHRSVSSSLSESEFLSWTEKLSNHDIFLSLKHSIPPTHATSLSSSTLFSLSASCKGVLLLWFPAKREINAISLVTLDILSPPNWPVLRLTPEPRAAIHQLLLSPDGYHCLLVSDDSTYLIALPKYLYDSRTYSHHLAKPLSSTIDCNQIKVLSRKQKFVEICEVRFSPEELTAQLIFVLCSDGFLHIFSPLAINEPVCSYNLNPDPNATISASISLSKAMGDEPVSFDFTVSNTPITPGGQWLSLYLLMGNGDVRLVSIDLSQIDMGRGEGIIFGDVLPMHPSPPDLYDDEACKLVCLRSAVPSFIIASAPGKLYHCVHLSTPPSPQPTPPPTGTASHEPDEMIFLLEVVDLTSEEDNDQLFSHPPRIITDPNSPYRYILCCENGVYNISLPSLELMNAYCKQDELGYDISLLSRDDSLTATEVDLILQTKSNQIYGVVLVSLPSLGPPVLLFTFKDGNCLSKDLPPINRISAVPLVVQSDEKSSLNSSLSIGRKDFAESIKQTLKSANTMPILKNQPDEEVSQEELYSLLINSTDNLRQQVNLSQYKALEELLHKAQSLLDSKQHLEEAIIRSQNEVQMLRENTKEIDTKIGLANVKYASNLERVHKVLQKILQMNPTLSKEEKKYQETLKELENRIPLLNERIQHTRAKLENPSLIIPGRGRSSSTGMMRSQHEQIQAKIRAFAQSYKSLRTKLDQLNIDVATMS